jgi:hypothetical protein
VSPYPPGQTHNKLKQKSCITLPPGPGGRVLLLQGQGSGPGQGQRHQHQDEEEGGGGGAAAVGRERHFRILMVLKKKTLSHYYKA